MKRGHSERAGRSAWPRPDGISISFGPGRTTAWRSTAALIAAAFEKLSACCDTSTATTRTRQRFRRFGKELEERSGRRIIWRFRRAVRTRGRATGAIELRQGARVIVEKPFGHDLASAQELEPDSARSFRRSDIFRIDHYLGKAAGKQHAVLPLRQLFSGAVLESNYVESVQITMAEDFGVQGRGAFYDQTGAIRDVVQNHLFQVLSNLAMEPPVGLDSESIRDEKVQSAESDSAIEEKDLVRGQFRGYRDEKGVAKDSKTETFAALKLEINSWRWQGVPFYIRAGKCLPTTCTEIVGKFRKPPTLIPDSLLTENHLASASSPEVTIAMGMMALAPGDGLSLQTGGDGGQPLSSRRRDGRLRTCAGSRHGGRQHIVRTRRLRGRGVAHRGPGVEKEHADLQVCPQHLGARPKSKA